LSYFSSEKVYLVLTECPLFRGKVTYPTISGGAGDCPTDCNKHHSEPPFSSAV
jgi:hypothetical protein